MLLAPSLALTHGNNEKNPVGSHFNIQNTQQKIHTDEFRPSASTEEFDAIRPRYFELDAFR